MKQGSNLRERIVNTALDIAENQGFQVLTQPRIAKTAAIRQSHLTYYFPRKADLFAAMLEASHRRIELNADDPVLLLQDLITNRKRMRFFLGVILELSEESELYKILEKHASHLILAIASHFNRLPEDQAVINFVDHARGIGIRRLISSVDDPSQDVNLYDIAQKWGLSR
ncbi:TetR/AcrR family transcriptional regulator [Zymomonas mobilis]|uniref:TetR/AcrR family transcriptional regulator n=1 Tax=Zymomonas mobilis TaxID=542 RepID=UPI0039EC7A4F